jgi:hypothetical protein
MSQRQWISCIFSLDHIRLDVFTFIIETLLEPTTAQTPTKPLSSSGCRDVVDSFLHENGEYGHPYMTEHIHPNTTTTIHAIDEWIDACIAIS